MKKKIIIIACLTALMLPVGLSAWQSPAFDPLMGAKELGTEVEGKKTLFYWVGGKIDSIDKDTVVVGDLPFKFTKDTKFYSDSGKELTRYNFYKGTKVKVVLQHRSPNPRAIVSLVKDK